MAETENKDWQLECGQIRQRGEYLLESGLWADCSFLLGPEQAPVKAHKLILAMASPVFQAMFYGPIAEGNAPIAIPDIQPDTFCKLLEYVYTDDINLDEYLMAIELYFAAQKYMLPHLMTVCTTYLSCNLVPEKACRVYEFAELIEDENLIEESLNMIKSDTTVALMDSSFEELALDTVIKIFSMDDINIDNELDLLAAAERYVIAWKKREMKNASQPACLGETIAPWSGDHALNDSAISMDKNEFYDAVEEIITSESNKDGIIEDNNEISALDNDKNEVDNENQSRDMENENIDDSFIEDDKGQNVLKPGNKLRKLLEPIRFLALTVEELAEYTPTTSLLTEHDMLAVMMNIASFETHMPMPEGFSECREYRHGYTCPENESKSHSRYSD